MSGKGVEQETYWMLGAFVLMLAVAAIMVAYALSERSGHGLGLDTFRILFRDFLYFFFGPSAAIFGL